MKNQKPIKISEEVVGKCDALNQFANFDALVETSWLFRTLRSLGVKGSTIGSRAESKQARSKAEGRRFPRPWRLASLLEILRPFALLPGELLIGQPATDDLIAQTTETLRFADLGSVRMSCDGCSETLAHRHSGTGEMAQRSRRYRPDRALASSRSSLGRSVWI